MFTYYKSTCYGTAIQRILRGSFLERNATEIVFVKGSTLELLQLLKNDNADDNHYFKTTIEQPAFGTITDARTLTCRFSNVEEAFVQATYSDHSNREHCEKKPATLYTQIAKSNASRIQGEDVLVVVSEYGKLVFLAAVTPTLGRMDQARFEQLAEVSLAQPGMEFTKIGRKLAVDPHSRAIAVSSFQDRFDILILSGVMSRSPFMPIVGMGSIEEQGIIWHMEFLHTATDDRERILLAMVLYNDIDRTCRIAVYSINATDPENVLIDRVGRLPLERATPLPLLLIPLQHLPESFMLVTEQQVCLLTVDDVACGNVLYPTNLIPRRFGDIECPLMTAYAFPISDPSETDYLYLGSAEGLLYKVLFPAYQTEQIQWVRLGSVNPVGPAMSCIGTMRITDEVDETEGYVADIVVYAGEGSDSQIIAIERGSTSPPRLTILQTLPNRAPVVDMQTVRNANGDQDMIVHCSGQDEKGSLCVFSKGIEADLIQKSPVSWHSISRLWRASASIRGQVSRILVASSDISSHILLVEDDILDISDGTTIEQQEPTVASGSFILGDVCVLVQVHRKGVVIVGGTVKAQWSANAGYIITKAAVCPFKENNCIAICLHRAGQNTILILQVTLDDSSSSVDIRQHPCTISLRFEPSYIGFLDRMSGYGIVLIIGTYKPSFMVYSLQSVGLQVIMEKDLVLSVDSRAVPHSAAMLKGKTEDGQKLHLLLGFRDGSILCYPIIDGDFGSLETQTPFKRQLGICAVRFESSVREDSVIFALSDRLWQIQYDERSPDTLEIENVLLPPFARISAMTTLCIASTELACLIADGQVCLYKLGNSSHPHARKLLLGETPRKILLDRESNCVFTITASSCDSTTRNTLRIVDLMSNALVPDSRVLLSSKDFGPTDTILSMAEWSVHHRDRVYRYICLGIGQPHETSLSRRNSASELRRFSSEHGVLLLYRLKIAEKDSQIPAHASFDNTQSNIPNYVLRLVWNQEHATGGVYAICPHSTGLLFSAGPVLHLYQLDLRQGKLVEVTKKTLRFLITSISVNGDRICVGSQRDSMSFYRFNPETKNIEFLKSDITARSVHHSFMVDGQTAVAACESGGLIALRDDPNDRSFERRLIDDFSFHYPDIIVRPNLSSILAQHQLSVLRNSSVVGDHILPWKDTSDKPISAATVAGGFMTIHRVSEHLFRLLNALHERMCHYKPSMFFILGSVDDFRWFCQILGTNHNNNILHGDLLTQYLRLTEEEQRQIVLLEHPSVHTNLNEAAVAFMGHSARNLVGTSNPESADGIAKLLCSVLRTLEKWC